MAARAAGAIRSWDARIGAEHGADAVWVAVSHGDPIKAILADALGMHLDSFQRIVVDPASISIIRYTDDPAVRDHRQLHAPPISGRSPRKPRPKQRPRRLEERGRGPVGGGLGAAEQPPSSS